MKPDVFSQVAFDNADFGQENNWQHITNIVIYQYPNGSFSENSDISNKRKKEKP